FEGERVLDLFAGTGGLGIEALSRGAASAVFIDASTQSIDVVRRNLESTKLARKAEVDRNDAKRALKLLERKGERFDLIFLDPPYVMKDCHEMLMEMADRQLVSDGAVAVVEHHPDVKYDESFGAFERTKFAAYGETALSIYRYRRPDETERTAAQEAA